MLAVELTRLGDVMTVLPAIRLLAQRFPDATIHLLVDSQYKRFLQEIALPCNVHGVDRPESVGGFLRAVLLVRRLHVDLALSMSPPKRNAAVALASGSPRSIGYLTYVNSLTPYLQSTPVESFGCALQDKLSYARENIEERSLKVCQALGISEPVPATTLLDDEVTVSVRRNELAAEGKIPNRQFVVLHPFSGWQFRSWPLERFNKLAHEILERLSYDVVFVCAKEEYSRLASSHRLFAGRNDVYFFASDNLMDTSVIFKESLLVVCNDSGPLHLAAALGVRIIGLFGPASPALTAPRNASAEFLFKNIECSPCDQCVCIRPEQSCMTLISPDEVFHRVMNSLCLNPAPNAVANA